MMKSLQSGVHAGPLTIVLFGGTGNLATSALYPSMFALQRKDLLPKQFAIVVYARSNVDTESLRSQVANTLEEAGHELKAITSFTQQLHFVRGSFEDDEGYQHLARELDTLENGNTANRLLYLATPPGFFKTIIQSSAQAGLLDTQDGDRWVRIGIEKPFGESYEGAQELDACVHTNAQDAEIYHIDHYLNKEMTASLLFLRFSNAIFNPVWNNKHISNIQVVFDEQEGVETRGSFYDSVGALRDVGQNHVMSLLSIVVMDTPQEFTHREMSSLRAAALKELQVDTDSVQKYQYTGFTDIEGVSDDSQTDTYFAATLASSEDGWKGVPIQISGGKGVVRDEVAIHIDFNDAGCLCIGEMAQSRTQANRLSIIFKPTESMRLSLWNKIPGVTNELEEIQWELPYGVHHDHKQKLGNTYERVLYDMVRGDATLFAEGSELLEAWRITNQMESACKAKNLEYYKQGNHPLQ
jgi:glucose-6-phosphate 1-dehydrogenase